MTEFNTKDFGDYSITPITGETSFELDVKYCGFLVDWVTLDALEVYNNLKEYFKGTKYE